MAVGNITHALVGSKQVYRNFVFLSKNVGFKVLISVNPSYSTMPSLTYSSVHLTLFHVHNYRKSYGFSTS